MSSVAFVVAHYHDEYALATLRALEPISASFPNSYTVFVANHDVVHRRLVRMRGDRTNDCEVLRHDNTDMEFGAYQAGIDRLLEQLDPDWLVIANDTCATHGNFPRVHRERVVAELKLSHAHPVVLGRVHALPRSYQIDGLRTNRWMQSNLFVLNRVALQAVGHRAYRPGIGTLIRDSIPTSRFFSPTLDPVLRDHLDMWLFRAKPGPHWYGAAPLDSGNSTKMARKARAILYEIHLGAMLDAHSAEFRDLDELTRPQKIQRKIDDKLFDLTRWRAGRT